MSVTSSELGHGPPPAAARECTSRSSPLGSWGGHTPLRGKGWGGPNSDEGTDTLVLYYMLIPLRCTLSYRMITKSYTSNNNYNMFRRNCIVFHKRKLSFKILFTTQPIFMKTHRVSSPLYSLYSSTCLLYSPIPPWPCRSRDPGSRRRHVQTRGIPAGSAWPLTNQQRVKIMD